MPGKCKTVEVHDVLCKVLPWVKVRNVLIIVCLHRKYNIFIFLLKHHCSSLVCCIVYWTIIWFYCVVVAETYLAYFMELLLKSLSFFLLFCFIIYFSSQDFVDFLLFFFFFGYFIHALTLNFRVLLTTRMATNVIFLYLFFILFYMFLKH